MYKVLGFCNIALLVVITAPYWLRKINQWFFKSKNKQMVKIAGVLRRAHKPLAVVFLLSMFVHGYLALGMFRLHTGIVVGAAFLITALFGLLFYLAQKPGLLKAHRALALLSVVLVVLHLLVPGLLNRWA